MPPRPAPLLVAVPLAGFAVLVAVGGALQPGYEHRRDYVSSLASVGARAPAVGVAAIAVLALAHAGGAVLLRRTAGARAAVVLLAGCASSGLVVAAARIPCPYGAAGCGTVAPAAPRTLGGEVHGWAVAVYAVLVAAAMLAAARPALRAGHRALAAASVPLAVASVALVLAQTASTSPGGWQRAWLAVSAGWLLLVAGAAGAGRGRTGR